MIPAREIAEHVELLSEARHVADTLGGVLFESRHAHRQPPVAGPGVIDVDHGRRFLQRHDRL